MSRITLFLSLIVLGLVGDSASAQIGFRQITSTHPVAVQRGKESEIEVRCVFTLDGCYEVFFDSPGMTMALAEKAPKKAEPDRGRGSAGTPFKFLAKVPADCPLGIREFRAATPQAVSSVGMILVTDFPVVLEQGKNASPQEAQSIPLPAAVCGVIETREDVDFYKFPAKKGQRLVFEIFAQRTSEKIHSMVTGADTYLMDAILTLHDSTGREIAQNDDYFGGDSFLAYEFPADGEYSLSVRDVRFNGDPRYNYCVEISQRPHVRSVYPLAVQQGAKATLAVQGENIGKQTSAEFASTADDEPGIKNVSLSLQGKPTNPVNLKISPYAQLQEDRAATEPAKGAKFAFPAGLNGQLEKPADVDYFVFDAKKGESYSFEVVARECGSLIDSVLAIHDAKGKTLQTNDDPTGTIRKDSAFVWKAPANGQHILSITDLSGNGGDGYAYHVQAELAKPDFEFTGEYYYAMLAPGNHMIWFVRAKRLNGFDGPIDFTVEDLPPGVTATPVTLPGHMTDGSIILSAAPGAKVAASLPRVIGTATVKEPDGSTQVIRRRGKVTTEVQSQGGGQGRWPINTQIVGVTEKMDLVSVKATPAEITLAPGGTAKIDVEIERHKDYTGQPVVLEMSFTYFNSVFGAQLPPGVKMSSKSQTRLTGNQVKGTIVLEADKTVKPIERLPIAPLAAVSISFSIATNYCSNPIYLTIPGDSKDAAKPGPIAAAQSATKKVESGTTKKDK